MLQQPRPTKQKETRVERGDGGDWKMKSLLQRDDEEQTWRSEKNCRRCRWTVRGEGDRDDNAGL